MLEQQDPWAAFPIAQPAPPPGAPPAAGVPQPVIPRPAPAPPAPNPGTGFVLNPDNTASVIPGSVADPAREAPDREDRRWQRTQSLRQEFDRLPQVREFNAVRDSALQLRRLGQNQTPQSDVAMVFGFMRSLDPTSAVRESEQATAQNAAGVPEIIRNYYNQLIEGRRLSPEQRRNMERVATDLYMARARSYNEIARRYQPLFRELGEDPNRHILVALGPDREDARARGENPDAPPQQQRLDINGNPIPTAPPGTEARFADEDQEGPPRLTEDQERRLMEFIPRARSAQEIHTFVQGMTGMQLGVNNAQEIFDNYRRTGELPSGVVAMDRPPPDISDMRNEDGGVGQSVDAYGRATANAVLAGIPDRLAAAGDTLFSGGTYNDNLRRQRAITGYDWQNHPIAATAGTVTGAALLPSGAATAGRTAATTTLRSGLGRREALSAASSAVGRRLGIEGTAYGGVQGLTEPSEETGYGARLLNSVANAGMGGGLGRAVGRYMPGPSASVPSARPPLIDPTTQRLNSVLDQVPPAERLESAQAFGIDLPPGAVGGRTAALIEKGLDILPGSAGVMEDARSALRGQVDGALENVASRYGTARDLYSGGSAAQQGARNWISRFDTASERAYSAIPISPDADTVLPNARTVLRDLTSRFQSNPELAETFRNPRLERWRDALENGRLSWRDLQDFRSEIGAKIGEMRFSEDPSTTQLRRLYGALSEDMRTTAAAQGPRALRSFERANNLYREGQRRIEAALTRILGDDSRTNPEAAARAIQSFIRSGRGSPNIDALREIRSSMGGARSNNEWGEVASSVIHMMGQPANSAGREFNPTTFVQNYADMSEEARNLLFSGPRQRGLRQALDEFTGVMQRLSGTNALRNTSQTAPGITSASTVASLVSAPFSPSTAAGIATVMGGSWAASKLWTNPAFIRWMTGYVRSAATRSGGVGSMSARRAALMRIARTSPVIADEVEWVRDQLLPEAE